MAVVVVPAVVVGREGAAGKRAWARATGRGPVSTKRGSAADATQRTPRGRCKPSDWGQPRGPPGRAPCASTHAGTVPCVPPPPHRAQRRNTQAKRRTPPPPRNSGGPPSHASGSLGDPREAARPGGCPSGQPPAPPAPPPPPRTHCREGGRARWSPEEAEPWGALGEQRRPRGSGPLPSPGQGAAARGRGAQIERSSDAHRLISLLMSSVGRASRVRESPEWHPYEV